MNYEADFPCRRILEGEPFISKDSGSVLATLTKVPAYVLYPVISRTIKSNRFRLKRALRVDSDGEESVPSSSGSGHEGAYKPRDPAARVDAESIRAQPYMHHVCAAP